jgi:hypothetical protein
MNELRKIWSRILGIEKLLKDGDEIIIVDALPTHPVEGVFYQFNNNFYHYVNGAWQTAVYVPGDVSELTDTTNIIPHASGDLTDGNDLSKAYAGTPLNATHAEATLLFDGSGTSVVAGKTVTIKDKVYTYVDALTVAPGVEGEVLIGADDTTAMANLMMAINNIGVSYGVTHWCTVNADDRFKDYSGANGMIVESIVAGLAGNLHAVSTDIPNAEWQNSGGVLTTTLVGGMNATLGHVGDRYFPPADPAHFWVAIADNGLTDENWVLTDVKYENLIIADRATLEVLVAGNLLEVGKDYLLSDFAQSYNIFDGGTMAIQEEKIGALEPLILKAIATNKFDKVAISPLRPNDIIHYSFDILDIRDIGFGNGVDTVNANFKGQIYYRKDTIQNVETHYDFRNVKFRRWAVDAVAFDNGTSYAKKAVCKSSNGKIYKCITATTGEGDPAVNTADWILWLDITANAFVSWTADKTKFKIGNITTTNLIINNVTAGVDYDDFYTFGDWYNWVKNVSIGMIDLERTIKEYSYATQLNNIVFKTIDEFHTCFGNNIGSNCWNNTIGNKFYSNTIGNDFYSNTIGNKFYSNTIGNNFYSNAIGNDFYSNTIGNGFYSNTIGDAFNNNTIGEEFNYNTIGNYFGSNTIGNGFGSNTIGNYFYSNTIGNKFYYNTIGNNFKYNTIGNYFYSNTIGNGFGSNTIGDAFNNNTIGNNFSSNTTGNDFYKTIFGDNCQYNTIDNKINGTATDKIITFGNSITMCTIQDFAFGVLAADLNLTTASHIRGAYNTTIYQDKTDGVKLSYMDGGVPQYVDVTA